MISNVYHKYHYNSMLLRWFKDGAELKPGDVYQLSGSRSLGKLNVYEVGKPNIEFDRYLFLFGKKLHGRSCKHSSTHC